MIQFDIKNIFAEHVGEAHGISQAEWQVSEVELSKAQQQLQVWEKSGEASFLRAPHERDELAEIKRIATKVREKFSTLVVLGIGGSALGTKCLLSALTDNDALFSSVSTRVVVCDNIDPSTFYPLLHKLDLKKTCFYVVSKSGGTTETISQLLLVMQQLQTKLPAEWKEHVLLCTDARQGKLRAFADEHQLRSFVVPSQLGGRFSVLSPVGLLPAAVAGVDIDALLDGADYAQQEYAYDACNVARIHFLLNTKKQKHISVLFPYTDKLSLFADWYIQLWAESLGKEGKGQTPLKALGATDQHSQLQLFMEGPNDKVFTFFKLEQFAVEETQIKNISPFSLPLEGKKLSEILHAQQMAVAEALRKVDRPNICVKLARLDAKSLGGLFMVYEMATALSGALHDINPFNQPGVELAKKLTEEYLQSK
ncbi:MAG: glucose-6-phosphate isomerase [Deltaproteobacteria bacterium CG11_big_fil_rev_8_21_14_0_20_42_23]|nr:MAG: glucose-6-phosphate isomerase [Deltaproteobacteria bacterium CG11_big_fil_rev_8_21_14_0_20_42_23]PJC64642.1 MAG: glucose-6-phosphate isomerase [Deltaproteobacteria bacterium CG_4_9_14_0_2_um_filter_42_21]